MRVVALTLLATSTLAAQPQPIATFRGDPSHAGVTSASGVPFYGGLLWRFETQGPVRSSPTLVEGQVFVGSGDGHLYALDAKNGRELWRFDAGSAVSSGAAVTRDRVYFTSLGGCTFAVRRADGGLAWRVCAGALAPLPWGHEGTDYYASSPVVGHGLVIVGNGDGSVYGLDATNGRERWRFGTGGRVRSSPALVDGVVYVGSFDGIVYALDAVTGKEKWRHATEGASLESQRFGFDRRSIQSSPAVVNGIIYVGSRDGHLYALDARDGSRKWRFAHELSWAISSPAVRDSIVFEGSSDGHFVHTLRARDGAELWRAVSEHSVWSSPVVSGPLVYTAEGAYDGTGDGRIRALDVRTGDERWSVRLPGGILSTPAVGNGMLVVGSDDGSVYALGSGDAPLRRAVFWDSLVVRFAFAKSHAAVRDHLREQGYEVLDFQALRAWMQSRVTDRSPSVLVFAVDYAPRALVLGPPGAALFRRYLDGGGKIVWLGLPPRMWVPDSTGQRSLSTFGQGGTSELLGFDLRSDPFDSYGARVTPAGRAWGLSGWFMSAWASPVPRDVEVLAEDERGLAAAWYRRYGGPPGTGLVQIGRLTWDADALRQLVFAAEYRPASNDGRR